MHSASANPPTSKAPSEKSTPANRDKTSSTLSASPETAKTRRDPVKSNIGASVKSASCAFSQTPASRVRTQTRSGATRKADPASPTCALPNSPTPANPILRIAAPAADSNDPGQPDN